MTCIDLTIEGEELLRALEELADHRHHQLRVAVLGQGLLDEKLLVAQERNGAQLGGGLDGKQVHGPDIITHLLFNVKSMPYRG